MANVLLDFETVGFYKKLHDMTTVPRDEPPRLNEDHHLYGNLRNELDLSLGSEGFKDEGDGDVFHSFFDFIKKTAPAGSSLQKTIGADFVSNRRILQLFATSAFHPDRPMEVQAIRKNGVIFLCEKQIRTDWNEPYPYGYKFKQYMTLDEDGEARDKYERVSNAESAKTVFRTTLTSEAESIKVMYAAEIDSIDSAGRFVDIKTTAKSYTSWLCYDSLRSYFQSLLGNVSYVVLGYKKKKEHSIFKVDKMVTDRIPEMIHRLKDQKFIWNKEKGLQQLFSILKEIQSRLELDDDAILLRFTKDGISYDPEDSDKCTFVDPLFLRHFD